MKRIISVLLAVVLCLCFTVNVFALGLLQPKRGDANLDGRITAADARLILRAAVGFMTPIPLLMSFYDVSGDGKISSADARTVLRVSVGLESLVEGEKTDAAINALNNKVSKKELRGLMKDLCLNGTRSIFNPKNNTAARDFIVQELTSYGYKVNIHPFTYNYAETSNVVCVYNKKDKNAKILLLTTHYDCWDGAEGAIDNASGVAALLHVAKIIKEQGLEFDMEIRFAFFSAEEMGYYGAYDYLSTLTKSEKNRLSVFNIDMAGHSNLAVNKYLTVSTEPVAVDYPYRKAQSNEISIALEKAKKSLGNLGEDNFYSPVSAGKHDIVPFRKEGIPAVTLSWREIDFSNASDSDYGLIPPIQIHTVLDTYENFDMDSLVNTTRLILSALFIQYAE